MVELNDFSLFLLAYREDHRLSQGKLAELLGISKMTVSAYERGVSNPRYDTLCHISRTLKKPVTHMFPIDCI